MKICIIGVGNIGMRYVQGIRERYPGAELALIDNDARLRELEKLDLGRVTLSESLQDVQQSADLCAVATSCESRLFLYKQCLEMDPRYIILDKYLFKSRDEFRESLTLARVPTFVNQWMYGSGTFDSLFENGATSVDVVGSDWGLACNAVHWIDVLKRHLQITHLKVATGSIVSEVFPSKRAGYEEIYGELVFEDRESDKRFRLIDQPDIDLQNRMKIIVDGVEYDFDFATVKRGVDTVARFPYFSEQIGDIVANLLDTGSCALPTLQESVSQHLLIEDILETLDSRPKIT